MTPTKANYLPVRFINTDYGVTIYIEESACDFTARCSFGLQAAPLKVCGFAVTLIDVYCGSLERVPHGLYGSQPDQNNIDL